MNEHGGRARQSPVTTRRSAVSPLAMTRVWTGPKEGAVNVANTHGCAAGDIVRTVAASPSLTGVAVLAAIVLIRTFLSFSLEVETTGRWPWQQRDIAAS